MSTPRTVVVDADGHVCEPADLWEKGLPGHLREHGHPPALERRHRVRRMLGRGRHGDRPRSGGLRQRGHVVRGLRARACTTKRSTRPASIRASGSRCSTARASISPSSIPVSASSSARSAIPSSRWRPAVSTTTGSPGTCATDPTRLVGVGALPMQDPVAAAGEARRIAGELGLRGGFCRPNPYGGHGLHDPVFDPVYEALRGGGHPAGAPRRGPHRHAGRVASTWVG